MQMKIKFHLSNRKKSFRETKNRDKEEIILLGVFLELTRSSGESFKHRAQVHSPGFSKKFNQT